MLSFEIIFILVSNKNNETEALLLLQTSPVGVELFLYFKASFCRN